MGTQPVSTLARIRAAAQNFFEEKGIESDETFARTRWHRFAHFWLLVFRSFSRNRCPVRAASLAYTTLLALVPLLAVVVSITTSMLQKRGQEPVEQLIDKLVNYAAPALDLEARWDSEWSRWMEEFELGTSITGGTARTTGGAVTNASPGEMVSDDAERSGRQKVVSQITAFIGRINSGTLGFTSVLVLLFVAISLLRTIESTFNDMWGVIQGRSWIKSIVYYWTTITLGPLFLVGAVALNTSPHFATGQRILDRIPILGSAFIYLLPFFILSLGFGAFYALIPNTKVQLRAALVGGMVGGSLWQLNNIFSVIYVSRVTTYTNIYGSLAVVPLFLVGLYFSWLIMLFGAQVAYAYQNRLAYIQEKQAESVNQRGREFVALRLMTKIAEHFLRGQKAPTIVELSKGLGVPGQLASKIVCALVQTGLIHETSAGTTGYVPARPLDRITVYDVLCALRAGQGLELITKEDLLRLPVRAEFEKVAQAEREAGSSVTLEMLARGKGEVASIVAE